MTVPLRSGDPIVVNVELGSRAYDITIGRGLLATLGERIAKLRPGVQVAIVTDETVAKHHLQAAETSITKAGLRCTAIVVPAGESTKSYAMFGRVCEDLIAAKIERSDVVVALGGGVVGDLAGFCASVLRRGLDVIQVPTTLLAQVDSSVGGKTAINSPQGKNLIGAFFQPIHVLADTAVLDTLPPRLMRAGYAEIAKMALMGDAAFFAWLEKNAKDIFTGGPAREHAVAVSCRAKAAIVARDERETGDRMLLNLGHTFGHALEAFAGYSDRLLHGEAVALGTMLAFAFSANKGLAPQADAERVVAHLAQVGLPTKLSDMQRPAPDADALMTLIAQDKKVRRGALTFILTRGIGDAFIARNVDPAEVRAFLAEKLSGR